MSVRGCVRREVGLAVSHAAAPAGALLYDARELFDQQNAKADEGLRGIVQTLPEAVATCVDAAQAELEEPRQVALMKVGGRAEAGSPSLMKVRTV